MKRKTILSFLTGAALLCSMPSCMNLDEEVYDKLPAENFGNTTTEINALVGTVYNTLKKYSGDYMILAENSGSSTVNVTRNGGDWYDGGFWQGLFLHRWGVDNDAIQATWEYLYKVIGLCNQSLERIDTYQETHHDTELPAYRAEVRAFRALYYYHLMDLFGRVPLILSSAIPLKEVKQNNFLILL